VVVRNNKILSEAGTCTGEEEADLELAELIQKGEVAWLKEEDAPKEAMSSGRRGGRPPASWKSDDYDDEEPAPSRGIPPPPPSFPPPPPNLRPLNSALHISALGPGQL